MKPIQYLEGLLTTSKVSKSKDQTVYSIKQEDLPNVFSEIVSGNVLLKKGCIYILESTSGDIEVFIAGTDEPYDSEKVLSGGVDGVTQGELEDAIRDIDFPVKSVNSKDGDVILQPTDLGASEIGDTIFKATDADAVREAIIPDRMLVPEGGTNGQVLKITSGEPAWGADSNTTYSVITEAEFNTGTSDTARAVSATSLNRDIQSKIVDYLLSLPNAEAGNVLTVNSTADGFEWVTPSV